MMNIAAVILLGYSVPVLVFITVLEIVRRWTIRKEFAALAKKYEKVTVDQLRFVADQNPFACGLFVGQLGFTDDNHSANLEPSMIVFLWPICFPIWLVVHLYAYVSSIADVANEKKLEKLADQINSAKGQINDASISKARMTGGAEHGLSRVDAGQ